MKINERNLCIFATTPPYDIEGFLSKRGEVNKAFQRRYFVLKGNLLFYFERRGDKEPLGLIIVEGCTIELSEESDQYCFEIAFNGNRTYILSADTQESMELWMKALTCAGYEYKRLIVAELQRQLEEIEETRNKIHADSTKTHTNANALLAATAVPRPPPRRQNPFNRPAPPVPGAACSQNTNAGVSEMPFINGHFNAATNNNHNNSNKSSGNENQREDEINNVPMRTGREVTSRPKAAFYVTMPELEDATATATTTALPTTNTVLNNNNTSHHPAAASVQQQKQQHSAEFEKIHEKFRQICMRDIEAYRAEKELKSRPLIEL